MTDALAQATDPAQAQAREQLKQSIQDMANAARDAAQAQRDAAQARRDARSLQGAFPPPLPGAYTIHNPRSSGSDFPPEVVDISLGFFAMCAIICIGWPLARAFGKRIERRAVEPAPVGPQVTEQLQRIEQAVDAMAIEIERISESQRFIAKLQNQAVAEKSLPR